MCVGRAVRHLHAQGVQRRQAAPSAGRVYRDVHVRAFERPLFDSMLGAARYQLIEPVRLLPCLL